LGGWDSRSGVEVVAVGGSGRVRGVDGIGRFSGPFRVLWFGGPGSLSGIEFVFTEPRDLRTPS